VLGSVSQMLTVLMATLESVSRQRQMRDRSPRGPPSASRASPSSPQTELIMCGVQASAPTRSGLEGFEQIDSFIVVCEQLIVCVQYVDIVSNCRRHV
jgi:hypothetical protein